MFGCWPRHQARMLVPDRGDPTMKIGLASLRRIVPFKLYWPTLIGATGFPGTFAASKSSRPPTKSSQERWPLAPRDNNG
jgi:hypothetical protein